MKVTYDIDFNDEDYCPQYRADLSQIENIILNSKSPLTARQIREKCNSQFLWDLLETLEVEKRISVDRRCVSITRYGKPQPVEKVEKVVTPHPANQTVKHTTFNNAVRTVKPDFAPLRLPDYH